MNPTELQLTILELLDSGLSKAEVSRQVDCSDSYVSSVAKKFNGVPLNEIETTQFLPLGTPGTSSLLGPDGIKSQWVSGGKGGKVTHDDLLESAKGIAEAFSAKLPKAAKQPEVAKNKKSDLMNVHVYSDFHFGIQSFDSSVSLADQNKLFMDNLVFGLDNCPDAATGCLVLLGDTLHIDSIIPKTPASGHILDTNSGYFDMANVATRTIIQAIEVMRRSYKETRVVLVLGNHDPSFTAMLSVALNCYYEGCKDVVMVTDNLNYAVTVFGDVFLGFHHGHKRTLNNVDQALISIYPREFGVTDYRYVHTGHYHHVVVKEGALMTTEQHASLAPKDDYSKSGAYENERGAFHITYKKGQGEFSRFRFVA